MISVNKWIWIYVALVCIECWQLTANTALESWLVVWVCVYRSCDSTHIRQTFQYSICTVKLCFHFIIFIICTRRTRTRYLYTSTHSQWRQCRVGIVVSNKFTVDHVTDLWSLYKLEIASFSFSHSPISVIFVVAIHLFFLHIQDTKQKCHSSILRFKSILFLYSFQCVSIA